MRKMSYLLVMVVLLGGVLLIAFAPNPFSLLFAAVMEAVVFFGMVFGLIPVLGYLNGLHNGVLSIEWLQEGQTDSAWMTMMQMETFFNQRTLDQLFQEYKEKLRMQRESKQFLSDIEDFINEEALAVRSWQSVILQIPGTLTGLGILGTFIGLLMGIGEVSFSSVDSALNSVQLLLNGIELAFYSSIAGVILSILFNISYRIVWNMMLRDLELFIDEFHKNVIPPVEEQQRFRELKETNRIIELLDRIPSSTSFSTARGDGGSAMGSNEQVLMPQILEGLKRGEFMFHLQPRYDLNSRRVIGGEALVRWKHSKLGMISPAVFIPVLEKNGYITKLDQHIWEEVCKIIRLWLDQGNRPVPISVNVTKTDILAMDVSEVFVDLIKKYRIPPRSLEIEISQKAYMEARETTYKEEKLLRENGFRVVLDGFDGDYIGLNIPEQFEADALKLDLRALGNNTGTMTGIISQGRDLGIDISVEGIESMEQLSALRKAGCMEGQGYYFSKPVSIENFLAMMRGEDK